MKKNISIDTPTEKPALGHCSTHGLQYPAAQTCPLCLHGLSTTMKSSAARGRRAFGGVVGLAVAGLLFAMIPSSWIERGLQIALPVKALRKQNADLELSAVTYASEIALLEAILDQPGKPQSFEAERIALFVEQLSNAITTREDPAKARLAQKRLREFAQRVQQNALARGDANIDLHAAREDWRRLRSHIFTLPQGEMPSASPTETAPSPAPSQTVRSQP